MADLHARDVVISDRVTDDFSIKNDGCYSALALVSEQAFVSDSSTIKQDWYMSQAYSLTLVLFLEIVTSDTVVSRIRRLCFACWILAMVCGLGIVAFDAEYVP